MRNTLLLILLSLLLAACATSGPPDITTDMTGFLTQQGLPTENLKCSMLGNGVTPGPDAMCLLPLTDPEVSAVVSTIGLQQKTDTVVSWEPSGPDCWTRLDFHDQNVAKWYVSPKNAPNLQLPSGAQFVYFRLFYLQDKSAGCISVSYKMDATGTVR